MLTRLLRLEAGLAKGEGERGNANVTGWSKLPRAAVGSSGTTVLSAWPGSVRWGRAGADDDAGRQDDRVWTAMVWM